MSSNKKKNSHYFLFFDYKVHFLSVCRYEIILKQNVRPEDLFLGLSRNNPSSMCCEAMLVI